MRGARLRHGEVRLGLGGVDEVGELHRVLDEEDRDVVADQIPVALVGVELHGEAAHVARRVGRAALAETVEKRTNTGVCLPASAKSEARVYSPSGLVALEVAVRRRAARVDDALGDALVVEVGDLLAEDEVLEQRRPAQPGLQRVLVVARPARPGWSSSARPVESTRTRSSGPDRRVLADVRRRRCRPCRNRSLGDGARADDRIRAAWRSALRGRDRGAGIVLRRLVGVERERGREDRRSPRPFSARASLLPGSRARAGPADGRAAAANVARGRLLLMHTPRVVRAVPCHAEMPMRGPCRERDPANARSAAGRRPVRGRAAACTTGDAGVR